MLKKWINNYIFIYFYNANFYIQARNPIFLMAMINKEYLTLVLNLTQILS